MNLTNSFFPSFVFRNFFSNYPTCYFIGNTFRGIFGGVFIQASANMGNPLDCKELYSMCCLYTLITVIPFWN